MQKKKPLFVISLDFELYWGMIDAIPLHAYKDNILGVREAIPALLELFTRYQIHATWATVGMLMYRSKQELLDALPEKNLRPSYPNPRLSSYHYLERAEVGENENNDPYHFGHSLVEQIAKTPHQEIASHTFSHYYCRDGRENSSAIFAADCTAMEKAAAQFSVPLRSIVFPRNQTTQEALRVAKEHGIKAYRGNEDHFLYRPRKDDEQYLFVRGARLLDHYLNISGHHTYSISTVNCTNAVGVCNVPASRFLRPYNKILRHSEPLRIRRIKNAMTHAARRNELFHLWWHPHNFGTNLAKNIAQLCGILEHAKKLDMQSCTMHEITNIHDHS